MEANTASAAAQPEKTKSTSITRLSTIHAAKLPIRTEINAVNNANIAYSVKCVSRMRRLVAPRAFKMTACWMRRRWAVASAPASTSAPARSVTLPAARTPTMTRPKMTVEASIGALTRIAGVGDVVREFGFRGQGMASGQGDRRQHVVGRPAQGVGREHHDEVEGEALPSHVAQVGDAGGNVAAEHVHRNGIADLEMKPLGGFGLEGDERLSGIVGGPPRPPHYPGPPRHLLPLREP